jgi:hypothetical protein
MSLNAHQHYHIHSWIEALVSSCFPILASSGYLNGAWMIEPVDLSKIKPLPKWEIGFEPRRYKRSYPKHPIIAYEPHTNGSSKERTAEDALMNKLAVRFPPSCLYINPDAEPKDRIFKPGIGIIEKFLPGNKFKVIQVYPVYDIAGHLNGGRFTDRRTKSGKVLRDRSPDEPWTLDDVDALYAEVLTDSDHTTHYTYTEFPKGPVTVVAKHVKHNEQWYAKHLKSLGRGAPSSVFMTGKTVTRRVKAFMGPAGRSFKLVRDARCEECGGIIRYSKIGDAVCEDCGLIAEYPGIDEFEDGYGEGPSTVDYDPLSNFEVGAKAKDGAKASIIPAGDLVSDNDIHAGGKSKVAALAEEARSISKCETDSRTVINLDLGGKPVSRRYSTVRNSYSAPVIRDRVSVLSGVVRGYMGAIQGIAAEVTYGRILDEVQEWERINRGILPKPEPKHGAKPKNYNTVLTCREEGRLSIVIQCIKIADKDGKKLTAADLIRITGLSEDTISTCIKILKGNQIRKRIGICGDARIKVVSRGRNKFLRLIKKS